MLKAVIFDLDGTLLDTGEGVMRSVAYTFEQLALTPPTDIQLASFVGPPIKKHLMQEFGLDEATAQNGMNIFRKHYGESDLYLAKPYAGLEKLLNNLRALDLKIGVATYKREDQAKSLLLKMRLAQYFDVIHGSDKDSKLSKTDVLKLSVDDIGISTSQTVLVGDSDNDAIAARKLDCHFIGVTYGYGFKNVKDVDAFEHIGVATTCHDIFEIIKKY